MTKTAPTKTTAYRVTVEVSWQSGGGRWDNPALARSGSFERELILEVMDGEPLETELKRLAELKLAEDYEGMEMDYGVEILSYGKVK